MSHASILDIIQSTPKRGGDKSYPLPSPLQKKKTHHHKIIPPLTHSFPICGPGLTRHKHIKCVQNVPRSHHFPTIFFLLLPHTKHTLQQSHSWIVGCSTKCYILDDKYSLLSSPNPSTHTPQCPTLHSHHDVSLCTSCHLAPCALWQTDPCESTLALDTLNISPPTFWEPLTLCTINQSWLMASDFFVCGGEPPPPFHTLLALPRSPCFSSRIAHSKIVTTPQIRVSFDLY